MRIFLITDGQHNAQNTISPQEQIKEIAHEVSNEHIINLKLLNITGALKMPNIRKQITEVFSIGTTSLFICS